MLNEVAMRVYGTCLYAVGIYVMPESLSWLINRRLRAGYFVSKQSKATERMALAERPWS